MSKIIILKATKDAPEFISQGNLDAELKNGYFETKHRAFADSIIANGFAAEVDKKEAAPKRAVKSASRKPKTEAAKPTAAAEFQNTPVADETVDAAAQVEPKTEGETK